MMIKRNALEGFKTALENNKIVVLRGPKQSGKFTLCNQVFPEQHPEVVYVDCGVKTQKAHFDSLEELSKIVANKKILVIRNTQALPAINTVLHWCFDLENL